MSDHIFLGASVVAILSAELVLLRCTLRQASCPVHVKTLARAGQTNFFPLLCSHKYWNPDERILPLRPGLLLRETVFCHPTIARPFSGEVTHFQRGAVRSRVNAIVVRLQYVLL